MKPIINEAGVRLITCSSCGYSCQFDTAKKKKIRRRDGAMITVIMCTWCVGKIKSAILRSKT